MFVLKHLNLFIVENLNQKDLYYVTESEFPATRQSQDEFK